MVEITAKNAFLTTTKKLVMRNKYKKFQKGTRGPPRKTTEILITHSSLIYKENNGISLESGDPNA